MQADIYGRELGRRFQAQGLMGEFNRQLQTLSEQDFAQELRTLGFGSDLIRLLIGSQQPTSSHSTASEGLGSSIGRMLGGAGMAAQGFQTP